MAGEVEWVGPILVFEVVRVSILLQSESEHLVEYKWHDDERVNTLEVICDVAYETMGFQTKQEWQIPHTCEGGDS